MKNRKPLFFKFVHQLAKRSKKLIKKDEYFVFWASLLFYLFLFFNFNNKTLFLFFAMFIFILFIRFKTLEKALFWGLVASLPFIVGKTYFFNLIPATKLFAQYVPEGYNLKFVIKPADIIAIFMFPLLFIKLVGLWKKRRLAFDFSILFLFFLVFLVFLSTTNSKNPSISFLYFMQFIQGPLVFLYARYLIKWNKKTKNTFIFLFLSMAIFESLWVLGQFFNNGPLGRSIESYWGIVPFGGGADEDVWRYRPTGTFDHANYVAAYLLPLIILCFSTLYYQGLEFVRNFKYFLTGLVFALPAFLITLGRSAWFSLFFGIYLLTFILEKKYHLSVQIRFKKGTIILMIVLLLISPFFLLPRIVSTFNTFASGGGFYFRSTLTSEALLVIEQNFFLGTGLGLSVPEMLNNSPRGSTYFFPTPVHNWYLYFASEVGVLALLAFLFLLSFCLRKIFFIPKKNIFPVALFAACLAMMINGIFQPFLGSEVLLFAFLGILSSRKLNYE